MESDGTQKPDNFGKYIVREYVDSGGMAEVWKAEDPFLGGFVAIKELRPGFSSGRLRAEAQVIRSLNKNKTVVTVFDFEPESERGRAYYVMEFMDNGSLGGKRHPINTAPKKCIELLRPIAEAIDHAHKMGIIHRDIKPSNILFDVEDKPRLGDFSIAFREPLPVAEAKSETSCSSDTQIHMAEGFVGTPDYAAPELFDLQRHTIDGDRTSSPATATLLTQKHTTASDIYSLAVVAFQMLTGALPVSVNKPVDWTNHPEAALDIWKEAHNRARPVDITAYKGKGNIEFHKHYNKVFQKALNKDASARYKTAIGFINALEAARVRGPEPEVTFKELPSLLLGRSDKGSNESSAAAYGHIRRKGSLALGTWLFMLIAVIILWRAGPLRVPSHQVSQTLWELLAANNWRVFSSRLLGSGVFLALITGLLMAFPLCRVLAGTAARAGSDRYWKEKEEKKLKADLKNLLRGVEKPATGTINSRKKMQQTTKVQSSVNSSVTNWVIWDQAEHPSPPRTSTYQTRMYATPSSRAQRKLNPAYQNLMGLDELYLYLGFKSIKSMSNHKDIDEECTYLIQKCKDQVKLFRLQSFIDRKINNSSASAIDPARGPYRNLRLLEVIVVLLFAVLALCTFPAVFYWAENPVTVFTPWAAAGIITLWIGCLVSMWIILLYEAKPKR